MSEDWLSIYRRVATDAANERGAENLAASPVFREPASWMDAMRGAWSGETWMGRLTSEDMFGNALHKSYVQSWFPEDELNDPSWTPTQGNFRGVEQFSRELLNTGSRTEFEIKRLNLLDRQMRIETAASRNGVMHQLVAHILDPTIVIGYGVGRAALGLPARVVGARVAAVEAALVGSQQAMMAARYDDRVAGDAVRASAYAAAFGFVLGAGISKVMYGAKGKGWATGSMDFGTRQRAAAARQTTVNIVDETLPGTMERTERVARAYAGTTTELDKTLAKQQGTVARLANSLGIKAEDATDEVLAKLYAEGDKATRQRVTRLRKAQDQAAETGRERNLMDLERAAAEFAKDSDTWKSNAFAAIASGRAGIVASMLPRARVTADSIFERGIAGLPDNLNKTLVDAFDGLRTGARILTRSHGMDTGPGKMPGATIEDIHMREITMRMRTDEQLRTAAIHSIRNTAYPHALYTPTVRSITGVFRWSANKAMELPHVLSGGRRFKVNPLGSAEDELEGWLRKIADEVEVDGKLLKMDHIDVPDAVKELYKFRQGQFQEVGKALRDHNMMYIQRSLNEEYMRMDSEMDLARKAMEEAPAGSREWDQAFDAYDRAMRRMEQIDAQAEAYKLAEDPSYQPVSLMAHKVRADKEGFIKAAMDHFWANPRTVTRQSRFKPGPTKDLPVAMTPLHVEGRALALWHATVWRTDYAGRPVGRHEFIRKLDDVIDELAPGRREKWADYNEYVSDPKAAVAARPTATTVEEAAADALILRVDGIKQAEALTRGDAGGRYLQSEMFETGRLDPVRFAKFIEDRPTIQFRAYLERELRRVIAAEKLGDPDGMNPLAAADLRMRELKKALEPVDTQLAPLSAETRKVLEEALEELTERSNSYDLLRRQMMGEVLFENSNSFIDKMNTAAGLAANISTAADLGMAGYSVTIDLGQMLAYHGLGPIKLGRLLNEIRKDPIMRKALQDPALRHQLGVAGEVVRGARLRAIQGADSTFGNQGGFLSTGNYFADLGRWTGNLYAEAASNVMNASLLNPITDLTQMLASPLATTRIMQAIGRVATGTGEKIDANILRRIGMEPEMAARVWAQYQDGQKGVFLFGKGKAGGELTDQGAMILPEFSTWRDPQLAEQVMAMIGGDIRVATLHPGIASNRVWRGMGGALQAVGRLYYMFTRWAMVSSANIYGKNIEDGTYQHTATALMYSTIIQAVVNLAKEPDFVTMSLEERLKNAMVMSGGFGYLGIMNERLERISGHQMGLRPLMGIDTFAHDPDSLRFRAQALGPPAGKAAAAIDNIQEGRYGSLGRLFMPYQNWWLWAGAVRIASDRTDALTED